MDVSSTQLGLLLPPWLAVACEILPKLFSTVFTDTPGPLAPLSSKIVGPVRALLKKEGVRRMLITFVILAIIRVGFFAPIPGFARNVMPLNYSDASLLFSPAALLNVRPPTRVLLPPH